MHEPTRAQEPARDPAGRPSARRAPGPKGDPLIGHLRRLDGDRLWFFLNAARAHGDVVRLEFGPITVHLLAHPDHVRHVLQENHKNYTKQSRGFDKLRLFLGNGLLTSEGSFWLRQRRIAQPAFHRQRVAGFAQAMTRAADDVVDAWLARPPRAVVDVAAAMNRLTLRVAGVTLLGVDPSGEADALGAALTSILEDVNRRVRDPFDLPLSVPTPRNRRFHAAARVFDDLVHRIIAERRARAAREGTAGDDLLGMMMNARDEETGESMTDQQLRDEAMTIFVAGHETTANALAWTFYLLSTNPHVAHKLDAELEAVLPDRRAPTADDAARLTYTRMVVQEAMRLYPPAWIVSRAVVRDDEIGGYAIPGGSLVAVSPWVAHRNSERWPNPEGFDPERFTAERVAARPAFAYFPFGGGPRLCIGNTFAMLEAVLVVAAIARRVRVDLVPGQRVEPEPVITLRPRGGVLATIHPR